MKENSSVVDGAIMKKILPFLINIMFSLLITFSLQAMEDTRVGLPYCSKETQAKTFAYKNEIVTKMLNIGTMSAQEIDKISSIEIYNIFEEYLLENWENTTINEFKGSIQNAKDLAAWLLGNFIINFHGAFFITKFATEIAAFDKVDFIVNSDFYKAKDAAKDAAYQDPFKSAMDAAFSIFFFAFDKGVSSVPFKDRHMADTKAMSDVDIWRLNHLFVVAYISQSDFLEYSKKAFTAVKKVLDNNSEFNMTKEDVLAVWGELTWNKECLKKNLYIKSLKKMADVLSQY